MQELIGLFCTTRFILFSVVSVACLLVFLALMVVGQPNQQRNRLAC